MREHTLPQLARMLERAIEAYLALAVSDPAARQQALATLPELEDIRSLTDEDRSELAAYSVEQIGMIRRDALRAPRGSEEAERNWQTIEVCHQVALDLLHPPPPMNGDQVLGLLESASYAGRLKDESVIPLTLLLAAVRPYVAQYGLKPEQVKAAERLRKWTDADALPANAETLDTMLNEGRERRSAIEFELRRGEQIEFESIPNREVAEQARKYLNQLCDPANMYAHRRGTSSSVVLENIRCSAKPVQIAFIRLSLARIVGLALESRQRPNFSLWQLVNFHHLAPWAFPLSECLAGLFKRKLPYRDEDIQSMVSSCANYGVVSDTFMPHVKGLCSVLSRWYRDAEPPAPIAKEIGRLAAIAGQLANAPERTIQRRLLALTNGDHPYPMQKGEAWSDRATVDLDSLSAEARTTWVSLLEHCAGTKGSKPSAKWSKVANTLLEPIGNNRFAATLIPWFDLIDKPRTQEPENPHPYAPDSTHRILDTHADILKGLCWIAGTIPDPDLARALGRLAISAYRKIPGIGPRAVKIGNAAVFALGQMPGRDSLGQLAMLRVKVKFGTAQKLLEKALVAAAEREGLPRDEIEELAVPTYGLTDIGIRREPLGDYTAELRVVGIAKPTLGFIKPNGKRQKSVPAAIKEPHATDIKELKAAARDIGAMLPAQRDRIDGLFLDNKSWDLATWQERYLDHPLIGVIARRLIWRFASAKEKTWGTEAETQSAIWIDGQGLTGLDGTLYTPGKESTRVRLWHPIEVPQEERLAWRAFLEQHEIVQPFKQAHREVYLLTDAERTTGTYSNRYAAHVLRQHQFNALCAARAWKNTLRLLVDAEYPPAMRFLPAWGLRAEFWIEGTGEDYDTDVNEAGVFHHIVTDQVRFYSSDAATNSAHASGGRYGMYAEENDLNTPLPLDAIPPLLLSEIMRDIDLFVGVTSIGNNPAWQDSGPEGLYQDYWWSYSFGDLSATAETRRDILTSLIPRLTIADRCTIEGNFLIVRGDIRTYKIHLRSGNILMLPNDEYLCIVPGSRDPKLPHKLYLPFTGDRTLSIILSKMFLLADDTAITDRTITNQIGKKKK